MSKELLSATVFFKPGTIKPRKYRNVSIPYTLVNKMSRIGAYYVNWYDQKTGVFLRRQWIVDFKKE
jgi:hypothetical protein